MNTKDLQKKLQELFQCDHTEMGVAGLKDKNAVTQQVFSIYLPHEDLLEVKSKITENLPAVELIDITRHGNKLKMGHLLGNKFEITVCDVVEGAYQIAQGVKEVILKQGLPNFYGDQRFGLKSDNAEKGRLTLLGKIRFKKWLRNFLISAYSSQLFNDYVESRLMDGLLHKVVKGDVLKKTESGGLFHCDDVELDQQRFDQREVVMTGPIFGSKMKWPLDVSLEREQQLFDREKISMERYKKARVPGTRRACLVFMDDIQIKRVDEGLHFTFFLPKGSYATTLLNEFIKPVLH